jgi:transposase
MGLYDSHKPMYVDVVPNRSSPPAVLLRESWREGSRMRKRTIANLSEWPAERVDGLRRLLRGERLVAAERLFLIERSLPHGQVSAVLGTMRKLGIERLLDSHPSRQRDLVMAMISAQLLHHSSKLADTRLWHRTTLGQQLDVEDADENELYQALDWLLERKGRIEAKLAKRHLAEGALVFYDVTSSSYEGRRCPLAKLGYNRDGRKGVASIVYGTLADAEGRPVGLEVYPGNTADPATLMDQVVKLRERFGMERVVVVGDRGMITQAQITLLREYPGVGWVTTMRSPAIRELLENGQLQPSLFDKRNLAEIHCADYPGERLIACYNPLMAEERGRKRSELLEATEKRLAAIKAEIARRTKTPMTAVQIAVKVGKALDSHKVGKHFEVTIEESRLEWTRKLKQIELEQQLDGIYVVRTSEPSSALPGREAVRQYRNLSRVERIYRTLKGVEILVRPIRHRTEDHVRAHLFLCMLAYYVEWHMRQALKPLLFDDEELAAARRTRDPVKQAESSQSAKQKKATLRTKEGLPAHSFATLLQALASCCQCHCRLREGGPETSFLQVTQLDEFQRRAFDLLGLPYPVGAQ